MSIITRYLLIMMIAIICTIVCITSLYAQNRRSDSPNMPASEAIERNISEFLTPDGHFNLKMARKNGFQGSLNMNGFKSSIDVSTGQPVFLPTVSEKTSEHPDDIYWNNSISSLINGVNHRVDALTVYDGKLIAGGWFTIAGGVSANNIAAWDGFSWSPLGSGMMGDDINVFALKVYDGKLIAAGRFNIAGGVSASNIAAWDGFSWSPLGSGIMGDDISVYALTVYDGKLIAAGCFDTAGGIKSANIAAWDGLSWSPLGSGIRGDYPCVSALTVHEKKLWVGGYFSLAGGVSADNIAVWDGVSWTTLSSGIGNRYPGVVALTVYEGKLIIGGMLLLASGIDEAINIVSWDGYTLNPIDSGIDIDDYYGVLSFIVNNGKLIAGGNFLTINGVTANGIASWDGLSWSSLGSGVGGDFPDVFVLTEFDNKLIAGGWFSTAGGKVAPYIAAWTKGTTVNISEHVDLQNAYKFSTPYPNPFNPVTTISFSVPKSGHVSLNVYSLAGQKVATLVDGIIETGRHEVTFDGSGLASGVYLYRFESGNFSKTGKMLLMK